MTQLNKYDLILIGIALAIIPMLAGIFVLPIATPIAGVVAALLVGVAMFVIPPVAPSVDAPETGHKSRKGVAPISGE